MTVDLCQQRLPVRGEEKYVTKTKKYFDFGNGLELEATGLFSQYQCVGHN